MGGEPLQLAVVDSTTPDDTGQLGVNWSKDVDDFHCACVRLFGEFKPRDVRYFFSFFLVEGEKR